MTPNSENKRVWFITGASKGLGYAFTCAALKAGDKVVAVARTIDNLAKLKETYPETLLPLSLDVFSYYPPCAKRQANDAAKRRR